MALETVADFLEKVGTDAALQAELSKALESDNDREAVTALAKAKGYEFSSDELWAEVQQRQADFERRQASGELSDEELEAVAGGITPTAVLGAVSAAISGGFMVGGMASGFIKW